MSHSDDERDSYRTIKLQGQENYSEWELSIQTTLLGKDLFDLLEYTPVKVTPGTTPSTEATTLLRQARKAFALIIKSLSSTVQSNLSAKARDAFNADPKYLWDELKTQYSAVNGARQAVLLQNMWTVPIGESEDPLPHLARIRSAHAQINSGGENLSDRMLAYAMTLALPESFNTIKQSLWMNDPLSSAQVTGAIQSEWTRRTAHQAGEALFTKSNNQQRSFNNKHKSNNGN